MMLSVLLVAPYAVCLVMAACWDAATLSIPNRLSGAMAALFPIAALFAGLGLPEIGIHILFGIAALAVGYFLFIGGVFGGGDAKLFAATAIWTGPILFAQFVLLTALAGGLLACGLLMARKWVVFVPGAPGFVNRLLESKGGVPYGVAIMAGGIGVIQSLPIVTRMLTPP